MLPQSRQLKSSLRLGTVKALAHLMVRQPHLFRGFPDAYPGPEDEFRIAAALWPGALTEREIEDALRYRHGLAVIDPDTDSYLGPILPEELPIIRALWAPGPTVVPHPDRSVSRKLS